MNEQIINIIMGVLGFGFALACFLGFIIGIVFLIIELSKPSGTTTTQYKPKPYVSPRQPSFEDELKKQSTFGTVPTHKGSNGERLTANVFYSGHVNGYGKLLQNLYVPMQSKNFTEIDMVYIHNSFIFVIEVKDYSGWIFGTESNTYWTQTFKSGQKFKLYNPVKQNNIHRNALANYLKLSHINFFSVIVFGDDCVLKSVPSVFYSPATIITQIRSLAYELNKIIGNSDGTFTNERIDQIHNKLLPLTNINDETRRLHVERLERKKAGHL